MRIGRQGSAFLFEINRDWDMKRPLWRLWIGDHAKASWYPRESHRFLLCFPVFSRLIHGRTYYQGAGYFIVPGPWRVCVWRRRFGSRWHRLRLLVIRINRPGPCRSHRIALGPLRIMVAPSLGKLVRRDTMREVA